MDPTTIIILSCLVVAILGMFLVNKLKLKVFGVDLSYSKADNANKVHEIVHLALDHQKEIFENNSQIIRNQLTFADGILLKIANKLEIEVPKDKVIIIQHLIKEIVRDAVKDNGFANMPSADFAIYVSNKTSQLRQVYTENLGLTKFIESHDFSSLVLDLFTHAANCAKYWSTKSANAVIAYQQAYDKLIKQVI